MIIGIKVGSSLLTNGKDKINKEFILELCRQAVILLRHKMNIFIVSSGAIASEPDKWLSKNLRAGIGQPKLLNLYQKYFEVYGIKAAQMLLTDEDLVRGRAELSKRIMLEAFSNRIVPVINGNDVVDDEETKALDYCADNDRLFELVCLLIKADIAIIGFDQKGIIDDEGNIVRIVKSEHLARALSLAKGGNKAGYGQQGMRTKITVLNKLAKNNIKAILAPAKEKEFIIQAVKAVLKNIGTNEFSFGTIFLP
jgi:glutamate 5-kinase